MIGLDEAVNKNGVVGVDVEAAAEVFFAQMQADADFKPPPALIAGSRFTWTAESFYISR